MEFPGLSNKPWDFSFNNYNTEFHREDTETRCAYAEA